MAHVGQSGSVQNNIIYVIPDADEVLNALLLLLLEIFEDEIELLGEDEDDFIVVIASAVGQLSQWPTMAKSTRNSPPPSSLEFDSMTHDRPNCSASTVGALLLTFSFSFPFFSFKYC